MINLPSLNTTFLVAIRLGVVLLFTPIQAVRQLSIPLRLTIILIVSSLLVSNLSLSIQPIDEKAIFASALAEFANGIILSLSLYAAFSVFQLGGHLIESQIGLNSIRH